MRTGADALHVLGLAGLRVEPGRLDPAQELVAVVDVEDEQPVAAVLETVPDARLSHVKQALGIVPGATLGDGGSGQKRQRGAEENASTHAGQPIRYHRWA